jgi:hypothetical protein
MDPEGEKGPNEEEVDDQGPDADEYPEYAEVGDGEGWP